MELMFELGLEHRKGRKAIQGSSLCSLSFHFDGIWPGSSVEAQYSMILCLKYESVSQDILYNLFTSREIIFLITSCHYRLYPFIHSWFDLCEFTDHWLGVYTAGFTVVKKQMSDLRIVHIALWEMNDEENKQTCCAAGGVTPRNGSQSSRRCQPKRRVCFLRARQG